MSQDKTHESTWYTTVCKDNAQVQKPFVTPFFLSLAERHCNSCVIIPANFLTLRLKFNRLIGTSP